MDAELLTVPEVMMRLRLSRAKVYGLIASGELPSVKIGRCRRIVPSALAAYIGTLATDRVA